MLYCGEAGSSKRCEYTAIGYKVNIAARLMQHAGKMGNIILCDEETYQASSQSVQFEKRAPIALKGVSHPVPVFTPHGAKQKGNAANKAIKLIGKCRLRLRGYRVRVSRASDCRLLVDTIAGMDDPVSARPGAKLGLPPLKPGEIYPAFEHDDHDISAHHCFLLSLTSAEPPALPALLAPMVPTSGHGNHVTILGLSGASSQDSGTGHSPDHSRSETPTEPHDAAASSLSSLPRAQFARRRTAPRSARMRLLRRRSTSMHNVGVLPAQITDGSARNEHADTNSPRSDGVSKEQKGEFTLTGRDRERNEILEALQTVLDGGPTLAVVVQAEGGMGKSALINDVLNAGA